MSTAIPPTPPSSSPDSPSADASATNRGSISRKNLVALIAGFVIVVAVAVLNLVHVPYAILRPGEATDTLGKVGGKDVISVTGAPTYPTSGTLDFTTVSIQGGPQYPVSIASWLLAKVDKNAAIYPEDAFFPKNITSAQVSQLNTAEMTNSQQIAEVVALRAAGKTVAESIKVAAVADKAPATGKLQVGDVLQRINGVAVDRLDKVSAVMAPVTPGTVVPVQISRGGKVSTVQITTAKGDNGGAVFGIGIAADYQMPVNITVNAGDVGGPSAGTMFSVAIYDKLTPGELTGGKNFAGTGTMSEDGTIGPIGGIRQKMIGAQDAGAKYFLAPDSDCDEARGHVPSGLQVIKVSTFNEAIAAVKAVAAGNGSGLPSCG